jgi:hypothetical protein
MGLDEWTCRLRQEVAKRCDGAGRSVRPPFGTRLPAGVAERTLARLHRVAAVDDRPRPRLGSFFPGVTEASTAELLHGEMPEAAADVLAAAERLQLKRFDLLGQRGLDFGDPIDWHLDPVSGRRAPLVHWSRIDPLREPPVRDVKLVWELNRQQWLVPLGQAYRLSGDERHAEAALLAIERWNEANPYGMGLNWVSSLEVALRLIAWCWTLQLLRHSPALAAQRLDRIVTAIGNHAAHIERFLSIYSSPNTHLTGEALGLFYAGTLFPELDPATRWRSLGTDVLLEQLERQSTPDGVYFEQATCYQRYTIDIYLHFLLLARCNGIPVPDGIGERLQRLVDFLVAVQSPAGRMPEIGDADGGALLPLCRREPADFSGLFATAAMLFSRGDYAWAANGPAAEVAWLGGRAGWRRCRGLRAEPPARPASELYGSGGYVVMRSAWSRDAHQLILDVGPLGAAESAGHGHADLLGVQCAAFGQPYLVDPGTGCYGAQPDWRDFFRSSEAHSTVIVDGESHAEPDGLFSWSANPGPARLLEWRSTDEVDYVDADHDAYSRLARPVTHRRRVLFVKPRYWILVDDVEGDGEHLVQLLFQFAPLPVSLRADRWVQASGPAGRGLFLKNFSSVMVEASITAGAERGGWFSPAYGERQPAPVLVYTAATALPLRLVTLLVPQPEAGGEPPQAFPVISEEQGVVGLILSGGRELVLIDDQAIRLSPGPAILQ